MTVASTAVEFRSVSFRHVSGRPVLSEMSFTLSKGEALALVGRSGSGKTTVLKLINRLFEPSAGEVLVEGVPTTAWDPIRLRRRIGYVIQEVGLFPHLTVARNVGLVPTLEGWEPERIRVRVRELLRMVGLAPERFGDRYPHELSGGQRQRVGVARAVAADPPLVLMDEPFGALDPITRAELQQEFRDLQMQLKRTLVFVTHDIPEACLLGSRIGLVQDGRLVECLTPEEFLRSEHPEVQAVLRTLRVSNRYDR
ncbi:MAG: ATP-binding cassette domain-containing protein [Nitrospirae bacterium]|nr:MAG: ABC transporter ATP-binding protein [Nitrospirae bacterium 13_2_20CM_62_7]TLY41815.1 MAG: ATP-binding cassette domain-containing protein [Nitrospirota bacterium]TLY42926.1 MAG: ATP-binding cassette domain-containing protein [Nitrospirota bacterium]